MPLLRSKKSRGKSAQAQFLFNLGWDKRRFSVLLEPKLVLDIADSLVNRINEVRASINTIPHQLITLPQRRIVPN